MYANDNKEYNFSSTSPFIYYYSNSVNLLDTMFYTTG